MHNNTSGLSVLELSSWERFQLHPSIIVFCLLLLLLGVPGNVVILYIYTRRINIYICGFFIKVLAIIDLTNSIGVIPAFLIYKIHPSVNASLMCKYLSMFHNFSAITTGVLYVVIAVQRYKKICRPHQSQFTTLFAKKLTAGCITFSVLSGLPILFILTANEFYVEWTSSSQTQLVVVPICDFTKESKRLKLSLLFSSWLFLLLVTVLTNLVVLYSLIGRQLKMQAKRLQAYNVHSSQSNITKMFFSLAVIFLITLIPRIIQAVYFSQTKKLPQIKMEQLQIFDIVPQLPYVNCIVNPFVYGFSSRRFRHELRQLLCLEKHRENTSNTSASAPDSRTVSTV